ncbi:MAG TPA: choice-of-anchor L domain-containing protein [Saprospiraceae bacterium]|nr:choice-of-anchor L domain-containing protein [Saprospiraceae bacterium]HMQ82002.1 choice-of-anchor L domain-containing protein [Saprospiraceae bacterium]
MKRKITLYVLLLMHSCLLAQMQVNAVQNNDQVDSLVRHILADPTISVIDVQYAGNFQQLGRFADLSEAIGLESGLIMSTGAAEDAAGFSPSQASTAFAGPGDIDLTYLSGGLVPPAFTYDAAVISFSFIPSGTQLSFDYIYASEEYLNFICSNYADFFGAFISGPGIDGGNLFSQNAINMSTIPGTVDVPVCCHTINDGMADVNFGDGGCTSLSEDWQSFSYLFQGEIAGQEYAGYSVLMPTRTITVIPGQIYHLKLVIADSGDEGFDSSVFLKAGSLRSGNTPTLDSIAIVIDTAICDGASLLLPNNSIYEYNGPGHFTDDLILIAGDTVWHVEVNLMVHPTYSISSFYSLCAGENIEIAGYTYDRDTSFMLYYQTEHGCDSLVQVEIDYLENNLTSIMAIPGQLCVGEHLDIIFGRDFTWNYNANYERDEDIPLPDGTGTIYETAIQLDQFPPGAVIQASSVEDIKICINIEHSWLHDLEIRLICPNGTPIILHNYLITDTQGAGETFLGIPYEFDDWNTPNPPSPGIGWTYCWTAGAPNGTWREYATANQPGTLPEGDYSPYDSFDNLIGCPWNGAWILQVGDFWSSDNGWIFNWSIVVEGGNIPVMRGWLPSEEAMISGDSLSFTANEAGTYDFTYVVETANCDIDTTFHIEVLPTIDTSFYDISLCYGSILENVPIYDSGTYSFSYSSIGGCDSVLQYVVSLLQTDSLALYSSTCNPSEAGTFTSVFVNQYGCDSTVTYVVELALPEAAFSTSTNGLEVSLEAANANDPGLAFAWNLGNNDSAIAASLTYTYNLPGCYPISLEVSNDCGTVANTQDVYLPPLIQANSITAFTETTALIPITLPLGSYQLSRFNFNMELLDANVANFVGLQDHGLNDIGTLAYSIFGNTVFGEWLIGTAGGHDFMPGDTLFFIELELGQPYTATSINILSSQGQFWKNGAITAYQDFDLQNGAILVTGPANVYGYVTLAPYHPNFPQGIFFAQMDIMVEGLASDTTLWTNQAGWYNPGNAIWGDQLHITPSKDGDPAEGLSTLSILRLLRHINGQFPLQSPYPIIAADANCNEIVDYNDALRIRDVILENLPDFSPCPDWVFTLSDYVFPIPNHPFPYPNVKDIAITAPDMPLNDWYGIKVGDLLGEAEGQERPSSEDTLFFNINNGVFTTGETIALELKTTGFDAFTGYQMGLAFDTSFLSFSAIVPGAVPDLELANFGLTQVNAGTINNSWYTPSLQPETLEDGSVAFTLVFQAKQNIEDISQHLHLSDANLSPEAYDAFFERIGLALVFDPVVNSKEQPHSGIELYQNQPNPFREATRIGFFLPEAAWAQVEIRDVSGKIVWQQSAHYGAGRQELVFDAHQQLPAGVYQYSLITDRGRWSKMMVVE